MVQRLRLIVDYLKSSKQIRNQQDFVERVGSDKSAVSLILDGKRQITKQFVSSVCEAFPFISEDWLLYGSGEMLSGQVEARVNHDKRGVPYYDVDFIGGFDVVLNDQSVAPAYYIDFPTYNDSDLWINVRGNSMHPLISSGDMVAIKLLNDWRTFIVNALYLGIPSEVIMRWTGHKNFASMKPYVKIVDDLKLKEMKKFDR